MLGWSQPGAPVADAFSLGVIGAHALHSASALLTLDRGLYYAAFPKLEVSTLEERIERGYKDESQRQFAT